MKKSLLLFLVLTFISCSKDSIDSPPASNNNNPPVNPPVVPHQNTATNVSIIIGDYAYDLYIIRANTGTIQWKGGNITSRLESPLYFDQKIYSPGYGGVFVYDINTEKLVWNLPDEKWIGKTATPIIENGVLYFGSDEFLFAYDAKSGVKKWEFKGSGNISACPTISNNILYFTTSKGKLYALNLIDGSKKWEFDSDFSSFEMYSNPCINNGIIYFGSSDKKMYAIDGTKKWEFKTGDKIHSSPTVADGLLYFGSTDHILYVLDATSGTLRKEIVVDSEVISSPIVVNGLLYFSSKDNYLYAYDSKTLQLKWKFNNGGSETSPTIANGIVYIGGWQYKFYAIDAITGVRKWEFATDDKVYTSACVIDSEGKVYQSGVSGSVN